MTQERILVIKLGALGDFVQALGPMAAIRKHHPEAHLVLLTTKPYVEMAKLSGYFDEILVDFRPKFWQIGSWISLRRTLNSLGLARIYDLQNNDRTGFYFRLLSTPRPEWVGIAAKASHRNSAPTRNAGQAFDGHVQTLALAGIHDVQVDTLAWLVSKAQDFSFLPDRIALIVPGSSPRHLHKRWPISSYGALCKRLSSEGVSPVLLGSMEDAESLSQIQRLAPLCINLAGKTSLFDLPALAHRAMIAIGNDTGPMHLIAPTGCPSFVLFSGKSHPHRHAPKGEFVFCLQKKKIEDVSVEEVWREIENHRGLIGGRGKFPSSSSE